MHDELPGARDKSLFTPGPLTTSRTVKQAMLRDLGSRDESFIQTVARIRRRLLELAGVSQETGYECVPMQGSGTFAIEATLSSCISPAGKLLAVVNGAYGERIVAIAKRHRIETIVVRSAENEPPSVDEVRRALAGEEPIEMVAAVHCETTSGIMNPIDEIGQAVKDAGRRYFVDSMSAFGAVPLSMTESRIDYLVSSANKCIEGVPGFSFCLCRREALEATEGWARTVSLDLLAQWTGLEGNGQFRFTPPTHAFLAFDQALLELDQEGGVAGRGERYRGNHQILVDGMRRLGFEPYVAESLQSPIIVSYRYPTDPKFDFADFYQRLSDRGLLIYPGKVTGADCFRIGVIGRLFPSDIQDLLRAIPEALGEMGVAVPVRN
ncbi:MAG: 2-aminoethylphosphonate--pyruvate transaminase [Planctomycetota bacterium]